MSKITDYPAKTVPNDDDELVLHDSVSNTTKRIKRGDLLGGAPLPAESVDNQAIPDGEIELIKLNNNYRFSAYKSANSSLSNTETTTVIFNTESFDPSSSYNNTTGVFTAPVAGYYLFIAHVRIDSTAARYFQLHLAGQKVNDETVTAGGIQVNLFGSVLTYLAQGGQVSVGVYHDGTCTVTGSSSECVFSGHLLSV